MKERGIAQQFSIKELEHFTGIKSHTIRAWEQRYNLLLPKRTPTNIRYYSGEDLKKLLNVGYLIEHGGKISKIAQLSSEAVIEKVREMQMEAGGLGAAFSQLKLSMLNYDEVLFKQVVSSYSKEYGFDRTVLDVFLPFLSQIGVLWLTNTICPAQEHFICHLMRQELNAAVAEEVIPQREDHPPIVLYLPEREIHDVSLLFIHFLCRAHGKKSIFLGASVPFSDLVTMADQLPNAVFVSYCTTHPSSSDSGDYVEMIEAEFAGTKNQFLLGGKVFEGVKGSERVKTVTDGGALMGLLLAEA
ncbi:MAG: helix-turn-helix-type transcriptional regulator [Crocinitomicaceae bacterium]|nr:helix-turn-helix-type transcriptional regulator [Crocinitomicaceae bacterium]